jgi:outer membrane murein-binding lipoprotein Lpp
MKTYALSFFALLLSVLLLAGCGKTAQQKEMESDLNKRVMQLHDAGMAKVDQAKAMTAQLDTILAQHEALAAKFPKAVVGHTSDDINAAKEKLASATSAMQSWMAGHKPYDINMKHEEVMSQLNADLQALEKVGAQLDTAIADATGTIESHQKFATEVMAKMPAKKGKK